MSRVLDTRPMIGRGKSRTKKAKSYMPKVSKKHAKELREYSKVSKQYLKEHPICEYEELGVEENKAFPVPCTRPSNQIHHLRGRVGKNLIDIEFFLAVCPMHHRAIHDNPLDSYQREFMIKRI